MVAKCNQEEKNLWQPNVKKYKNFWRKKPVEVGCKKDAKLVRKNLWQLNVKNAKTIEKKPVEAQCRQHVIQS